MTVTARIVITAIITFSILLFTQKVTAESSVKVNVSNNGNGSSSNVDINNNIKIESNSDSKTSVTTNNSSTDIIIESNGERKEYHSSDPNQDINLESSDGNASVRIKTNSSGTIKTGTPTKTNTKTPTSTPSVTKTPTPTESDNQQATQESNRIRVEVNDGEVSIVRSIINVWSSVPMPFSNPVTIKVIGLLASS